jgi:hypothetical protein
LTGRRRATPADEGDAVGGEAVPPGSIDDVAGAGRTLLRANHVRVGATGVLGSAAFVVGVGAIGPVHGTTLTTDWLGLLSTGNARPWWAVPLVIGGVCGLVAAWLVLMLLVRQGRSSTRRVCSLAALWGTPLALGPPMLSNDVFSYAAHGVLQLSERDPYRTPPAGLGHSPVLSAVDPRWRFVRSPYGPVATWLEHAAAWVGRGNLVATVLLLRALAVVAVILIGYLAVRTASASGRPTAAALTVANPLLLLQGLSAVHLEVFMGVFLLAALWAASRGRPATGVALACLAGAIKIPALLGAGVILVIAARESSHRVRRFAGCVAAAVAVWAGLTLVVPDAWGWVAGLSTPGRAHTPVAPTQLATSALAWLAHGTVPTSVLETVCRTVGAVLAVCIVGWLVLTSTRRPAASTVGLGLLAVAALAPVVYPWYLLWGVLCLSVVATRRLTWQIVILCAGACFIDLPGQSAVSMLVVEAVMGVLLAATFWIPRAGSAQAPDSAPELLGALT